MGDHPASDPLPGQPPPIAPLSSDPLPTARASPRDSGTPLATFPRSPGRELRVTLTTDRRTGSPVVRFRDWVAVDFADGSTGMVPQPGRTISVPREWVAGLAGVLVGVAAESIGDDPA